VIFLGYPYWFANLNTGGAEFLSRLGYVYNLPESVSATSSVSITNTNVVSFFASMYKQQSPSTITGFEVRPSSSGATTDSIPLFRTFNGDTVTWSTNKSTIIDTDTGVVTFPILSSTQGFSTSVTVTATVRSSVTGTVSAVDIHLIVFAVPPTLTADRLNVDKLYLAQFMNLNLFNTSGDITLPATGPCASTITWSSSNPQVMDNNGIVKLPTNPVPTAVHIFFSLLSVTNQYDEVHSSRVLYFLLDQTMGTTIVKQPFYMTSTSIFNIQLTATLSLSGQSVTATIPIGVSNAKVWHCIPCLSTLSNQLC
jgi:hypothetical protein